MFKRIFWMIVAIPFFVYFAYTLGYTPRTTYSWMEVAYAAKYNGLSDSDAARVADKYAEEHGTRRLWIQLVTWVITFNSALFAMTYTIDSIPQETVRRVVGGVITTIGIFWMLRGIRRFRAFTDEVWYFVKYLVKTGSFKQARTKVLMRRVAMYIHLVRTELG